VITSPANGSTAVTATPPITGTGTTGDSISVTEGVTPICGPVPVTAGTWTCTPGTALTQGSHTIIATATNPAGSTPSTSVTFTVSSVVPPPYIASPTNGSVVNNGTVAFTGTGVAVNTVTVFESGQPLCTGLVNISGNWNCSPIAGLAVGPHTVVATQQNPVSMVVSGNSNTVKFTTQIIGTRYVPLTPYRVLDTRPATQVGPTVGPINAGGMVTMSATQLGVPAGTASAIVLNVTVDRPTAPGYITAYPSDQTQPVVSSLNFGNGQTRANLVIVPVAFDGSVRIYASAQTQVVADVFGYFSTTLGTGGLMHNVSPTRLLDTRDTNTPLGPQATRSIVVAGVAGVPASGISAVVLNVTVSRPTAPGFISAYPTGAPFTASTSNVNFMPNDLASTRVIVPVGAGGQVSFYNSDGSTTLVVDVTGYFTDSAALDTTGAQFVAVAPVRLVDSRSPGVNTSGVPLANGETRNVQLTGPANIPTNGTIAVVVNVTAVNPAAAGWFAQYAADMSLPLISDVNFIAGDVVANLALAQVDSHGVSSVHNYGGNVDLVEDASGYFQTLVPAT
jgi:hypothetical protein